MANTHPAPQTVELWIRSFTPMAADSKQARALERVERLEDRGAVDAVAVGVWGDEFEPDALSNRVPQLERVQSRLERFETWATAHDRRLEPCFRRRRTESQFTGETHDIWRLPTIALAEFDGDDLVHVAPCRDEDRTIDVFDRLEILESRATSEAVVHFDDDPGDRQSAVESNSFESVADRSTPVRSSSSTSLSSESSGPSSGSPPPRSD